MNETSFAVPAGYNSLTLHLIIKNAVKAIAFYRQIFGAIEIMRFENDAGKISHAEIHIGDSVLMLADEFPEAEVHGPEHYQGSPISLHLFVHDVDATFDKAIAAGAKLVHPVLTKFYGDRSGTLKDPFGHTWTISTRIETISPEELQKRATVAGIKMSHCKCR